MRNSSAVRKLPPEGTDSHPHEAQRKPDQVVDTTAKPRPQRQRKPPEYLGYGK